MINNRNQQDNRNQRDNRHQREPEQPKEFEQRLLDVARVSRMMAGGRRFKFRATVVIGNRKGKVGVGMAKGQDVTMAVEKGVTKAKKSLFVVPIVNGTIAHETEAKYGTACVFLRPAKEGKGIVAGGAVRVVCELAGIENIVGKIMSRSRNKINNAKATIKALQKIKPEYADTSTTTKS